MYAGSELLQDMETLKSEQGNVAWGLGAINRKQLSQLATTPALIRLYQLLLFTMPGTPVFTYGDEIGLLPGQVGSTTWCLERKKRLPPKLIKFAPQTRVQMLLRWFGTQKNLLKKALPTQQLRYVGRRLKKGEGGSWCTLKKNHISLGTYCYMLF